ncbi:DUF4832 domain-containing protein [Saccharibacillus sp. CPCC 101409]|uniref:DUF4832 domain-containing protein n=1 Tax=Saccharibacillus sp. CPCC 101409 TaxID=3058041 RepID=UPI00267376CD|nr:DUF4832 domain-containing protein [Saccharibacillus sp. CPCC 101409]MDO3411584.1 DUF4832 domain-containing protein [Saccharibacillus sp. CPCC 101409]
MYKKPVLMVIKMASVIGIILIFPFIAAADKVKPVLSVNYPAESDVVLYNPYIGLSADARDTSGVKQKVTLVHANFLWRELEPEEGVYDFAALEEKFNFKYWKSKGARLVLRVVLDYPTKESHTDLPDWLYAKIGGKGTHYDLDYGKGFSPDYGSAVLIQEHRKMIEKLAQRYNDDPFVAFIQLGSIGHWGEWHTMDEGPDRIAFPLRRITDQYVAPYVENFTDKILMMRRATQAAARYKMGLYNDAFGKRDSTVDGFYRWYTKGYTSWLTQEKEPAMPDFWKTAPSGGEFPDSEDYVRDSSIAETLYQAKLTHTSWLGPAAPWSVEQGSELQENIDKLLKTMGYRFVIDKAVYEKSVKAGQVLHTRMIIENKGNAPFYYKWPLEISLADSTGSVKASVRSSTDIRTWQPGKSEATVYLTVPKGLKAGTYSVQAAILDPSTGKPGVDFANENRGKDGRYQMGKVVIK